MLHMKKNAIVAVIGAMAGLGGSGVAHANAYAFASNQFTGFAITSTATFTVTGIPTRDTLTTANFSIGPSDQPHNDPQVLGTASNALQSTFGPGLFPPQNTFTPAPPFVGKRGDAFTSAGSPFDPPTVGNPTGGVP